MDDAVGILRAFTGGVAYLVSGSVNIGTGRLIDALLPEELPNELNAALEDEENT